MRAVVCGIGNAERGDDRFGPFIIERLKERPALKKIDCGSWPENHLNDIVSFSPDLVIFFDTVRVPGRSAVLLWNDEILNESTLSVSTHNLPFSAVYAFLKGNGVKDVLFAGVTARSYARFTDETRAVAEKLTAALNDIDKAGHFDIIGIYDALSERLR